MHLLRKFLHCIDNNEDFKPHVLDAMTIAQRAWDEVTPTTISNCFKHCKFVVGECDDTDHLEDHNALAGNETDVYDQLSQHERTDRRHHSHARVCSR